MSSSRRSRSRFAVSLSALVLCALGCQHAPGSARIVGPDGSPMSHVHCGGDQGACFRIAGELCPGGYELKPVLSTSDGNFLVRCKTTALPQVAVCPAPAAVAVVSQAPSPAQAWPPSNEPWPSAYPWPPPEPTAGVRSTPAPSASQEIDLGY